MFLSRTRISKKAFTLVEVLVVVVILGIVGAVVVPALSRPSTFSVQTAGRMVISDILIAQNDAIASQLPRSVLFQPILNRYQLIDDSGNTLQVGWKSGGTGTDNYIVDFNSDTRFAGVTLENVDIGGTETLAFDSLGSPLNGGNLDLVNGNMRYRITIAPFTGRVTIALVP